MIVVTDIYKKITQYNFVTLISAQHLSTIFSSTSTPPFSGVLLLLLSNTFWLFKIISVTPYYTQPCYNSALLQLHG